MEHTASMTADARTQFESLLQEHRGIVLKIAASYARPDDRADLAQDIAAQLWRAFPGYDARRPFSTWMYRIALNVAISFLRGQAPRQRADVPLEDAPELVDDSGIDLDARRRLLALQRFIAALDPLHRAVLLLYLEERSTREIAEIIGISETNVTTRISRLKQRIRQDVA
ncbi:RNA polymerase sigma factor [Lysobacter panacisoli]|uniref:Sigma-70 family RNA polymerase sigma factor n=1 Tax=Lysobacter panacisoli TaxID=1255263 RepID=A0ABP9LNR3_9GAMM|nr:sigma-70 family RNA polymerase sigma factor [Lysobacter panacisoli]